MFYFYIHVGCIFCFVVVVVVVVVVVHGTTTQACCKLWCLIYHVVMCVESAMEVGSFSR